MTAITAHDNYTDELQLHKGSSESRRRGRAAGHHRHASTPQGFVRKAAAALGLAALNGLQPHKSSSKPRHAVQCDHNAVGAPIKIVTK